MNCYPMGNAILEPRESWVFLRLLVQFLSPLRLFERGCSYRGFVLDAGLPARMTAQHTGVTLPLIVSDQRITSLPQT
jgi:hypothetical protein